MSTYLIKEIPVVGNDNDGVVKIDQEFLQPLDSRKIQMVGRLIQKKDIRIAEKSLGKKNFDLLASCQLGHLRVMEIRFNPKSV